MHARLQTRSRRFIPWLILLFIFGLVGFAPRPAHAAEVVIDQIRVNSGGTLTMRATGFGNREVVNTWVSGTDGSVITTANGESRNGVVTLSIKVGRFWQPGWWAITIRGAQSRSTAVGTFEIVPTPPDGAVEKDRQQVTPGGVINFRGTGFAAGEPIKAWLTLPDNTAVAIIANLKASGNGEVYFPYTVPTTGATGTWYITAYGQESERLLVGSFAVMR